MFNLKFCFIILGIYLLISTSASELKEREKRMAIDPKLENKWNEKFEYFYQQMEQMKANQTTGSSVNDEIKINFTKLMNMVEQNFKIIMEENSKKFENISKKIEKCEDQFTEKLDNNSKIIESLIAIINGKVNVTPDDVISEAKCESKVTENNAKCESKVNETNAKCESKVTENNAKCELKINDNNAKCESKVNETNAKCESKVTENNAKCESKVTETNAKCELKINDNNAKCELKVTENNAKCQSKVNENNAKCKVQLEQLQVQLAQANHKAVNACSFNPCNGGQCKVSATGSGFSCSNCPFPTYGTHCQNIKCESAKHCLRYNDKVYFVFEAYLKWEDANRKCVAKGMTLTMPKDQESNEWLVSQLKRIYGDDYEKKYTYFWMGLKNDASGKYRWTDGSPLGDYTGGRDDFKSYPGQRCGHLYLNGGNKMWSPNPCNTQCYPVCEKRV